MIASHGSAFFGQDEGHKTGKSPEPRFRMSRFLKLTRKEAEPMATIEKFPMLAEGREKLVRQLRHLKEVERPENVEAIEEARAHGDLSENAEYHAAKERQGQIEAQIADLEDKLARAHVIEPSTLSGDKVVFGATVDLLDEEDRPIVYQLVGEIEADAKSGRISYNSPLGRALIGRRVGEEVEVVTPGGDRSYLIEKVRFV
jgi:transcription elongation factor GreA